LSHLFSLIFLIVVFFSYVSAGLDTDSGMDFVSCGEDGSLVVWQGTESIQSIPHPNTLWCVLGWKTTFPTTNDHFGDIITAGQDGVLRIFSKHDSYRDNSISLQLINDFLHEVIQAKAAKRNGPSAEDLAKAPKWENRGSIPGKSEHQIHVFNRDGSLIAAEWNSGSWVFVGEVTGQKEDNEPGTISTNDAGFINGKPFDHVFPVEIETSTGLRTLQLGYNNAENPFVAAQRFINENTLEQHYLAEIADWILARSGGGGNQNTKRNQQRQQQHHQQPSQEEPFPMGSEPMVVDSTPQHPKQIFTHVVHSLAIFNDLPNISKLMTKLKEINESIQGIAPSLKITDHEMVLLENLLTTIENKSYYHSSVIKPEEYLAVMAIFNRWFDNASLKNHLFILYDILRLIMIHPHAFELMKTNARVQSTFASFFQKTNSILLAVMEFHQNGKVATNGGDASSKKEEEMISYQVLMTLLRYFTNLLKHEIVVTSIIMNPTHSINSNNNNAAVKQSFEEILFNLNYFYYFSPTKAHKLIRLSIVSFFNNLFYLIFRHHNLTLIEWFMKNSSSSPVLNYCSCYLTTFIHHLVYEILTQEKEQSLVLLRAFEIVFTLVNYSKWKNFADNFSSLKDFMVKEYLNKPEIRKGLEENHKFWEAKHKEGIQSNNFPELMSCFRELMNLEQVKEL
jgi:hypothetical protein